MIEERRPVVTTEGRTLRSVDVLSLAGCTYKQLDHWCRAYPIQEGRPLAPGSGFRRNFTSTEAKVARAFTVLGRGGMVFSSYAVPIIEELARHPDALWLVLVTNEDGVTSARAVAGPDEALDVVKMNRMSTIVPLAFEAAPLAREEP